MPVFDVKTMGEAIIHIVVALDNVGVGQGGISCITLRTGDWDKWGNTPVTPSVKEVLCCSCVDIGHAVAMAALTKCSFTSATSTTMPSTAMPLSSLLEVTNRKDVELCGRDEKRCHPGLVACLVSGGVGVCHHFIITCWFDASWFMAMVTDAVVAVVDAAVSWLCKVSTAKH